MGTSRPATDIALAYLALVLIILAVVNGALPQIQMFALGGHVFAGEALVKIALLLVIVLGWILHPKTRLPRFPYYLWLACIIYLLLDAIYLIASCSMSPLDVLLSYNSYYLLLMIGPSLIVFRGVFSERLLTRAIIIVFSICAAIAAAQHLTQTPIVKTQSADGIFQIQSSEFLGEVRAFSLFTTALDFGIFCAFCGALAISLPKSSRPTKWLLLVFSALACLTTLTRLTYLIYACACVYALVLYRGKRRSRGRIFPIAFAFLGILALISALRSASVSDIAGIQNASSTLMRATEWAYYAQFLIRSDWHHLLFGFGLLQNVKISPQLPLAIDNVPLALILHVGIVGMLLFSALMVAMWLYLRREAMATKQPVTTAAASLWATFALSGLVNIVFSSFGAIFALAIICPDTTTVRVPESPGNGERRMSVSRR